VRVEVRSDGDTVAEVRHAHEWPPSGVVWQALHLDASSFTTSAATGALRPEPAPRAGSTTVRRGGAARFRHRFTERADVVGPMWVRLHVEVLDAPDAHVFVGVDKVRGGRRVGFEGSYGFGDDLVTHGMLRVALRRTADDGDGVDESGEDRSASPVWSPHHPYDRYEPVAPGTVVALDIELHASATRFEAGDELHLVVQGRWFFPTNPLTGAFPARYDRGPDATVRLHTGADHDTALHLPVWR
jgi:putative CocE/NonD family hydrolase